MLIFSIISDSEVKLNDYKYPIGAHVFGWILVVIVLSPIPIYFCMHIFKMYKVYGFKLQYLNNVSLTYLYRIRCFFLNLIPSYLLCSFQVFKT